MRHSGAPIGHFESGDQYSISCTSAFWTLKYLAIAIRMMQRTEIVVRSGRADELAAGVAQSCADGPIAQDVPDELVRPPARREIGEAGHEYVRLRGRSERFLRVAVENVVCTRSGQPRIAAAAQYQFFLPSIGRRQFEAARVTLGKRDLQRVVPVGAKRRPAARISAASGGERFPRPHDRKGGSGSQNVGIRGGFGSRPKLPNLVFQALQRVFGVLGAQASLPANLWGSEQARMPALPGIFESDSFVDYVCSPELDERSGDMTRSEFHPAAQNCMKILWRRDQTKVGAVKKSFPNFRLVIRPQGSRILLLKSPLGTHRFQRAGVESGPIVD